MITESEPTDQFRLIDVFGLVTFVAVLLATLTPLLRLIDRETLTLVVTPAAALQVVIHFNAVILALAYAICQRKRLEKQAERRFGVAFCGPTKWESWPRMKSMFTLMGLICFQLVFVVAPFLGQDILLLALHSGQLALIRWSCREPPIESLSWHDCVFRIKHRREANISPVDRRPVAH